MTTKPAMSFTLRSLLLAFMVVASALGAFGPIGLFVGFLIVAGIAYWRTQPISPVGCLAILAVIMILVALLLPAVSTPREAARRMQCINNLKQIALALHCYQDSYGTLPPAYVPGPDGTPWHSWRVLILPFLEEQILYAKYNFSEPWDGPSNAKLAAMMPPSYACPSSNRQTTGCAPYFAVVGPETAWPGATSRTFDEITDGTSNTIVIMEAAELGVPWLKPQDLQFDEIARMSEPDPKVIGTVAHRPLKQPFQIVEGGAFNVAMADGHVESFPWGMPNDVLLPLLTAQGGEEVDIDAIGPTYSRRLNWPRVAALVTLVVSSGLLWWSTGPRSEGSGERASRETGERPDDN